MSYGSITSVSSLEVAPSHLVVTFDNYDSLFSMMVELRIRQIVQPALSPLSMGTASSSCLNCSIRIARLRDYVFQAAGVDERIDDDLRKCPKVTTISQAWNPGSVTPRDFRHNRINFVSRRHDCANDSVKSDQDILVH
jgi:hypothetical protein